MKTYYQAVTEVKKRLQKAGIDSNNALFMLIGRKNWDKTAWLKNFAKPISTNDYQQLLLDEEKLLQNVPPQYLLGFAEFFGERFLVDKHVLIPRPETEELVNLALQKLSQEQPLKIVDIGVGSGNIAITLAKNRPYWQVFGTDSSKLALKVAKENAKIFGVNVDFRLTDILSAFEPTQQFDLIISNPPYIAETEKNLMDKSVLIYEPSNALFAEQNGLAIYQKIAQVAPKFLKKTGIMLLEIGFTQGKTVQKIMKEAFKNKRPVQILPDLAKHDRFIYVEKEK